VLESLVEEDDEVVATWYLLGWMNFLRYIGLIFTYFVNAIV
jgi:hypothetical protein